MDEMEYIYWPIIFILFIIAFAGVFYPIIPSILFLWAGFVLYGFIFSFHAFSWFFWLVEGLFTALLFASDYLANFIGIKRFGGSKAGVWGSTIGLLAGPFIIPFFGIIIGPFIGAFLAELVVNRKTIGESIKIGVGSVIGFISSIGMKIIIQLVMVAIFLMAVFHK